MFYVTVIPRLFQSLLFHGELHVCVEGQQVRNGSSQHRVYLAQVGDGKVVIGSERQGLEKLLAGRCQRHRLPIDLQVRPGEILHKNTAVFLLTTADTRAS